jgi:hypothetical protein
MTDPTPAVASLQSQYLTSRAEAAECRSTADRFIARAAAADQTADSLAAAITSLGGDVPTYPAEPEQEPAEDPPDDVAAAETA